MFGAAGRNRTHDPLVRSQVLYPAELQPRSLAVYQRGTVSAEAGGGLVGSVAARAASPSLRGQLGERDPGLAARGARERRVARRPARAGGAPCPRGRARRARSRRRAPRAVARERAARPLEPRQPVGADAGARRSASASATRSRSSAPSSPRRSQQRAQPGARFLGRAERHARGRGARGDERVAPIGRVEAEPDAAQLVDVVRACRAPRRPASAAGRRGDLREALVLGQQARRLQRLLRLARRAARPAASGAAHGCGAPRRAAARRAAASARGASRSSSAHSAASSRAPSSAERAAGLRLGDRAAPGAAARRARRGPAADARCRRRAGGRAR